jgi:hypothetical protein
MRTISTTTIRSSTSEIPIRMRPCREWISPRSSSRRARTIVLATETTMPTTALRVGLQPAWAPTAIASPMIRRMPSGPPRIAIHFTPARSFKENSIPSENISRMTPISAKRSNVCMSATDGPGVSGLIRRPPRT